MTMSVIHFHWTVADLTKEKLPRKKPADQTNPLKYICKDKSVTGSNLLHLIV